jgi:hypothetical protein
MRVTRSVAVAPLPTMRLARLSMRKVSLRRKVLLKKIKFSSPLWSSSVTVPLHFAVYQTFLVCRQHALQLFTYLSSEQDAQQALSPLLLGISNLTVGREITDAKSPHGTLQVSYTNATTVSEVIEAHTGYAVTTIPKRSSTE